MDKFLEVIRGIDWDLLHEQKKEILQVLNDQERVFGKTGQLEGLVNLLDDLQDVAAKIQIWTFPSERYDGDCPECGSKNYEFFQEKDNGILEYECYDCGKVFKLLQMESKDKKWLEFIEP
jgi:DNA-directed RNA polymerase subunit RPC12/RpoP